MDNLSLRFVFGINEFKKKLKSKKKLINEITKIAFSKIWTHNYNIGLFEHIIQKCPKNETAVKLPEILSIINFPFISPDSATHLLLISQFFRISAISSAKKQKNPEHCMQTVIILKNVLRDDWVIINSFM